MIEVHIVGTGEGAQEVTLLHHGTETEFSGPIRLDMEKDQPHRLFLGTSELQPPFRVYRNGTLIAWRTPESDKALGVGA